MSTESSEYDRAAQALRLPERSIELLSDAVWSRPLDRIGFAHTPAFAVLKVLAESEHDSAAVVSAAVRLLMDDRAGLIPVPGLPRAERRALLRIAALIKPARFPADYTIGDLREAASRVSAVGDVVAAIEDELLIAVLDLNRGRAPVPRDLIEQARRELVERLRELSASIAAAAEGSTVREIRGRAPAQGAEQSELLRRFVSIS
jgi:hypothetical protein